MSYLNSMSERQGEILYHYTSMNAFFEIMKGVESINSDLKFWASHVSFMNDPGEYMYLIREIAEMLREHELFAESDGMYHLADSLRWDIHTWDIVSGQPAVFSLSEKRDELTMWQVYGQGGKGIAIGFDKDILASIGNDWQLHQCSYLSRENVREVIDIEEVRACFGGDEEGNARADLVALNQVIANRILVKHPAFSHEGEWRLSRNDHLNYRYRERNGIIIPYLELVLKAGAIREIWIGPTAYPNLSEKSLQMFLHSLHIHYELYKSSVPYANI